MTEEKKKELHKDAALFVSICEKWRYHEEPRDYISKSFDEGAADLKNLFIFTALMARYEETLKELAVASYN